MIRQETMKWVMAYKPELYEKLMTSLSSHREFHPASPFSEQFKGIADEMEGSYFDWLSDIKAAAMINAGENDDDQDL